MSSLKEDRRDMVAHAFVGGMVGWTIGALVAGPAGGYAGGAIGAYLVGKPRARELDRRANREDDDE